MGKASTTDSSSVEIKLPNAHFFVVTILLRTVSGGGGLPWWSGMEGREVVFLVPAARWRPVAGRSRMGW